MKQLNKILLVDDSLAINELNKYYLESFEICNNIYFSKNGEEALQLLSGEGAQPELIFLDIKMPVMNGFEFLNRYTSDNFNNENTKVILLTSSTNPVDIKEAKSYSIIKAIYEKPLNKDQIQEIIDLV